MKLGDQEMVFVSGARFCRGSRSIFLSQAHELGVSQMSPFLGQGYNPTLVDDCKVGGAFVFLSVGGFSKVRKQWLFMAVMEHEGDEWVKGEWSMHGHAKEVAVGFSSGLCEDSLVGVANEVLEGSHHRFSFFVAVYVPPGW